jgi:hypothetical protein
MELTLESAFSIGGLVGHFAYVLLIISMIMRRMVLLRIFVIASALVGIAYSIIWLNDPVSSFWETLLVTVNVIQLTITWRQNSTAKFTDEERNFSKRRLRGLSPHEQRKLLSLGEWIDLPKGHSLTVEGQHPDWLFYIVSGTVQVVVGRDIVAMSGSGSYIGELAYISGEPASATVETLENVRVWRISSRTLSEINTKQPNWMSALEAGIARDLRRKILSLNENKSIYTIGIT